MLFLSSNLNKEIMPMTNDMSILAATGVISIIRYSKNVDTIVLIEPRLKNDFLWDKRTTGWSVNSFISSILNAFNRNGKVLFLFHFYLVYYEIYICFINYSKWTKSFFSWNTDASVNSILIWRKRFETLKFDIFSKLIGICIPWESIIVSNAKILKTLKKMIIFTSKVKI